MSAFQTANPLWDFHIPPDSLTSLPDDDFLAILQSQMVNPSHGVDPAAFYMPHHDVPLSANPKALSRIPDPSGNSPLTDSSPSPPSGQETVTGADSHSRPSASRRRSTISDDALKRKSTHASDDFQDDDDTGPALQRSSTQDRSAQGKSSKRKSAGTAAADEQRLLKRKEQNRAAQRAFRERKEKHVKDLEDQLAASEAKNEATMSENENLKEMLRRLQTENTLLKQAAFTFSMPPRSGGPENAQPPKPDGDVQQFISGGRKETPSGSSSQASPNSLFEDTFNDVPGYSAPSSVATDSPKNFPLADRSLANSVDPSKASNPNSAGYGHKQDWISVPSHPTNAYQVQSPFTIISSNPTYMSFRDPSPPNSFSPFTTSFNSPPASGPSYSPFIQQQQQQQAQQNFLTPDFMMTDVTMNTSNDFTGFSFAPMSGDTEQTNLDDLFGGQYGIVQPFSPFSAGTSPVSGKPSPPQPTSGIDHSACTPSKDGAHPCGSRDDVARVIAAKGPSTFVTEPTRVVFDNGHIRFDGKPLPMVEKRDTNVDASLAYQSLQNHPKFKDIDEHELCTEFASKARCDGVRAVIPPKEMQELLQRVSGTDRAVPQESN